jgi:hypothetical protein
MQLQFITTITFALLLALAGHVAFATSEIDCNGEIIETSSITSLDFFNSVVTKNTLHLEGGELRYESKY